MTQGRWPWRWRRAVDLELDRRDAVEREVDEEIALHLEMRVERLMSQGMSRAAASETALRLFGSLDDSRTQLAATATTRRRLMRISERMEGIRDDVAYSMRQLLRAPSFSVAVIVTLGLGIGANATMYGAINELLLQLPSHVADPGRLMTVSLRTTATGAPIIQQVLSYPIYQDLRRATSAFESVGIYRTPTIDFGTDAQTASIPGVMANADYFRALGVTPALGRFFSTDEAGDGPGAPVAVLGYEFWKRTFNGDASIVGRTLQLAGRPHTVIGVAPEGFKGTGLSREDVWLPLTDGLSTTDFANIVGQRQSYSYYLIARLRTGITPATAAEMATASVVAGERAANPSSARAKSERMQLTSVLPRDARGDKPESRVAVLLGAVSLFVLLLACANVMNLQLARNIGRRREIAVRLALGVSRGRLVQQLALDCLLLGLASGVTGILVAMVGGRFVRTALLNGVLGSPLVIDRHVLIFSLVVALATGLVTGLAPAFGALRAPLSDALKSGQRGGESRSTGRARAGLLAAQAALTTLLLVGTGVFVLSLRRIEAVPLGFDADRIAFARLNSSGRRNSPIPLEDSMARVQSFALYERLEDAARTTPGVAAAALALVVPFEGSYAMGVSIPGRDSVAVTRDGGPYYNAVSSDYFNVLGIHFLAGRPFDAGDQTHSPHVVIVNETAARLWWPNDRAIGKCLVFESDKGPCVEIVGVVQNTRRQRIIEDDFVQVFVPISQADPLVPSVVLFRAAGDRDRIMAEAQRRMQASARGLPFINVRGLDALVEPGRRSWRLGATMFGAFGALALFLAAIGLYSVLAYDVAHRRQELGVRTALGAAASDLAILIVSRGFRVMSIGAAIGIVLSLAAAPVLSPLLFKTSPHDPAVFAGVVALLLVVSTVATSIPAFRAARSDASVVLRGD
jgi:predicted permease